MAAIGIGLVDMIVNATISTSTLAGLVSMQY